MWKWILKLISFFLFLQFNSFYLIFFFTLLIFFSDLFRSCFLYASWNVSKECFFFSFHLFIPLFKIKYTVSIARFFFSSSPSLEIFLKRGAYDDVGLIDFSVARKILFRIKYCVHKKKTNRIVEKPSVKLSE